MSNDSVLYSWNEEVAVVEEDCNMENNAENMEARTDKTNPLVKAIRTVMLKSEEFIKKNPEAITLENFFGLVLDGIAVETGMYDPKNEPSPVDRSIAWLDEHGEELMEKAAKNLRMEMSDLTGNFFNYLRIAISDEVEEEEESHE